MVYLRLRLSVDKEEDEEDEVEEVEEGFDDDGEVLDSQIFEDKNTTTNIDNTAVTIKIKQRADDVLLLLLEEEGDNTGDGKLFDPNCER